MWCLGTQVDGALVAQIYMNGAHAIFDDASVRRFFLWFFCFLKTKDGGIGDHMLHLHDMHLLRSPTSWFPCVIHMQEMMKEKKPACCVCHMVVVLFFNHLL